MTHELLEFSVRSPAASVASDIILNMDDCRSLPPIRLNTRNNSSSFTNIMGKAGSATAAATGDDDSPPPLDCFSLRSACSDGLNATSTLGESSKTSGGYSLHQHNPNNQDSSQSTLLATETPLKTNMRIRVVNEISQRFKDLLVPIQSDLNLFEAVYEHRAVKTAHVRKWGANIVQQVKSKQAEIRCAVWDDVVESPCHTFTVEEMKQTSTRQLYQLVPESDLIKLVLQCVEINSATTNTTTNSIATMTNTHNTNEDNRDCPKSESTANNLAAATTTVPLPPMASKQTKEEEEEHDNKKETSCPKLKDPPLDSVVPLKSDSGPTFSTPQRRSASSTATPLSPLNLSGHSPNPSTTNGVFRCPFSGIAVDESIFQDFESQIQRHRSHSQLDSLAASDYQSVSQRSTTNSSDRSERLYCYQNRRKINTSSSSSGQGTQEYQQPLSQKYTNPTPPMFAVYQETDITDESISAADESDLGSIRSNEDMAMLNDSYCPGELVKTTMRVRISNGVSQRFKDLVVDVKSDVFLYESVYEHQAVKNAHVRKWGPDIVRDVKKNAAEILCLVLDGADGDVCRTFTVKDLMQTSTKDLLELVPDSDPVYLILKCVKKKSLIENVQKRSMNGLFRERTTSMKESMMSHSKSEPSFLKRSSRLNHMNLSTMKNADFTTPAMSIKNNFLLNPDMAEERTTASYDCIPRRRRSGSYRNNSLEEDPVVPRLVTEQSGAGMRSFESFTLPSLPTASVANSPATYQSRSSVDLLDPVQLLQTYSKPPKAPTMSREGSLPSLDEAKQVRFKKGSSDREHEKQLKEFIRLCRSKKGPDYQSADNISRRLQSATSTPINGARNALFPVSNSVPDSTGQSRGQEILPKQSNGETRNSKVQSSVIRSDLLGLNSKAASKSQSDRINRFLQFSASKAAVDSEAAGESSEGNRVAAKPADSTSGNSSHRRNAGDDDDQSAFLSTAPPIAEIAVITGGSAITPPVSAPPSISLSGDLVKEVFPYHIVFDESFQILQVGNSLSLLIDGCSLLGRCVSDILQITGPIPTFGKWEWSALDIMKDNTVFLESVGVNSSNQKAKVKGTIIELSRNPRQIMLALFPNVKNLSELEKMHLSMADLPLHSCQREAVLLGEHSKSEVKLTNHLDQLHRDLINSMEKQIEDRTNELATANEELALANDLLARQSARQLEHFACMSHEIRTPLNCIVGMSSLLLEDSEESAMDPLHADSIRMINTSGELLKAVVDDVLDYAKLESGSFLVDIKPTKLQDTLNSVVHSISQKVKEKNIRLRTHFSPALPEILETDSRRLQQVLFNLLGNSGKFSKNNSVIDLSVDVVESTKREVGACSSHGVIRFSVKDYGKGIESKDFETIFQPFSQASKETQNVYGGTGLGLSITSKLVNRLGGSISVDSEYGKYAEFTVELPMIGGSVDVKEISGRLDKTVIVVVESEQNYDYSFTSYPIRGESHPLSTEVADVYGLRIMRCNSLEEVYSKLSNADVPQKDHIALLVHENLYDESLDEKMNKLVGEPNFTVMTHGPNYSVEKTKSRHFKSLSVMFPVALLDSIAKHVSKQREKRHETEPGCVSPSFTGGLFAALQKNPDNGSKNTTSTSKNPTVMNVEDKNLQPLQHGGTPMKPPAKYNLKVLYAEDNIVNQKVLSRVLNRVGITDITLVDDGKKAVDISATTKFDCIFMDMQMPIMDGMEACKLIMKRDPESKIIFVTAHALDEFKSKADSVGATSFISKPFRVSDINAVLEKMGVCSTEEANASNETIPLDIQSPSTTKTSQIFSSQNQLETPVTSSSLGHVNETQSPSPPQVTIPEATNLPCPPKTTSPKERSKRKTWAPSRNLKVLYAEDNVINQKVLSRVLSRAGITDITIVDDGKKAVDATATTKFDCIFMDLQMPNMDGMEATELIMKQDPESKIVFVTAHYLDDYKKQAVSLGARDFLAKPVKLDDIEGVLQKLGI